MLVRFNNIFVVDTNADTPSDFGEFEIHSDSGQPVGLRVDDGDAFDVPSNSIPFGFNDDSLVLKQPLSYVQGMLHFSFSNWKIELRNLNDVGGYSYSYPKDITTFAFLFQPNHDDVFCAIDQTGATITCDSVPAGTDITNLAPYIEHNGESIDPAGTQLQDFSSPVEYTVTAAIDGSTKMYTVEPLNVKVGTEVPAIAFRVWPNPTDDLLRVDLQGVASARLRVLDLLGHVIRDEVFAQHQSLSLRHLEPGIYFLELSGEWGKRVEPIVLSR
jgi:hypothetical protein